MKRNIEEKIYDLSYDSVRELTDGFELDNETKSRIYIKTIRRAKVKPKLTVVSGEQKKAPKQGRRLNVKKTTAVVVAAALAMTLGVGSIVGAGALNKSFGQYFHTLTESNYENMLFDINQTKTDNGVTVTLTQGMCDGLALYVIEKVEFDPSVITLTDDMFAEDKYGNCNAPYWGYSTLINVKETSESDLADIGGIVERQNCYQKLLEHDDHSMTYLKVFGYPDLFTKTDTFFSDGNKFTVRYSNMDNMPVLEPSDEYNIYDCHMDLTFNIPTVGTPNFYTLPEEIYSLTNVEESSCADVIINPWYMRLSAGVITGKVVDTSLNTGDNPEIEITMNNGTVYTEKNGISMYEDYLGADYNAYAPLFFEFDTPVDVTNIKSIKIYGHELKKGVVAADASKVRKYDSSSGMKQLPAESEVKFSDEPKTIEYRVFEDAPSYGQFKYKINSVKVYDNAYATGASSADDFNCELIYLGMGFDWNEKTGALGKDWYMIEYEIEMTNVNANFSESLSTFDFNNTGCFEQLFDLYCYNTKVPSNWNHYDEAYIRENQYALTGQHETIKLNKGETKTFHVSFFVKDNKAGGFEQIGLCVGGDKTEGNIEYVNISKMIEDFNASK